MTITIPLFRVNMPANMDQILKPVLESGFITEGPRSKEFETKLGEWIGNPNTAVVNSGTAALTLAYRLAGVGPGDEVITSPMTCLASNEPIQSLGGKAVFCDVDPATGNIDPDKVEALITNRTKAIAFTNWAGTPCELDPLNAIAKKYGIKTIEDAAHSLGAAYKGKRTGTSCDYTIFSFQAIKHMTTVDGGALSCATKEDYDRAVLLRWFGCRRGHNSSPIKWEGDVVEYGYKFHMNDVNAAMGIESLKTIDGIIAAHKRNAAQLRTCLAGIEGIELLSIPDYIDSAHWIFTLKLRDTEARAKFAAELVNCGVGSSIVHTRNDAYSLFKDSKPAPGTTPGLDDFCSRMLNIPCGWWLNNMDVYHVVEAVGKAAAASLK